MSTEPENFRTTAIMRLVDEFGATRFRAAPAGSSSPELTRYTAEVRAEIERGLQMLAAAAPAVAEQEPATLEESVLSQSAEAARDWLGGGCKKEPPRPAIALLAATAEAVIEVGRTKRATQRVAAPTHLQKWTAVIEQCMPHESAVAEQDDAVRAALQELVDLNALEREADDRSLSSHRLLAINNQLKRRRPNAWFNARDVLAAPSTQKVGEAQEPAGPKTLSEAVDLAMRCGAEERGCGTFLNAAAMLRFSSELLRAAPQDASPKGAAQEAVATAEDAHVADLLLQGIAQLDGIRGAAQWQRDIEKIRAVVRRAAPQDASKAPAAHLREVADRLLRQFEQGEHPREDINLSDVRFVCASILAAAPPAADTVQQAPGGAA